MPLIFTVVVTLERRSLKSPVTNVKGMSCTPNATTTSVIDNTPNTHAVDHRRGEPGYLRRGRGRACSSPPPGKGVASLSDLGISYSWEPSAHPPLLFTLSTLSGSLLKESHSHSLPLSFHNSFPEMKFHMIQFTFSPLEKNTEEPKLSLTFISTLAALVAQVFTDCLPKPSMATGTRHGHECVGDHHHSKTDKGQSQKQLSIRRKSCTLFNNLSPPT